MPRKHLALLSACLLLTACPSSDDNNYVVVTGTSPSGGKYRIVCAPLVEFQKNKIVFGGLEIPISGSATGPSVKIGSIESDPQVLRTASDLIESLDQAQMNYCRALPFASPEDVAKLFDDINTQQTALSTLLRNIAGAQSETAVKNAVVAAGNLASTASTPPVPAAVAGGVAAGAPAAPGAPAAVAGGVAAGAPAAPAAPGAPAAVAGGVAAGALAAPAAPTVGAPSTGTGAKAAAITAASTAAAALQAAAAAAKALP